MTEFKMSKPSNSVLAEMSAVHVLAMGDLEGLKRLYKANKKITIQGSSPMHEAVRYGHLDILKWLLERGEDIEARDVFQRTPMHVAAASN